jgi:hypothetical protein
MTHDRNGTYLEARQVGDGELEDVGQLEHDARPITDPLLDERARQAAREGSQLAERDPSLAVDHGASVTIGGDDGPERGRDGDALPYATRPVPCRHVLRPANDTFHVSMVSTLQRRRTGVIFFVC